jgi:hypothetical protein
MSVELRPFDSLVVIEISEALPGKLPHQETDNSDNGNTTGDRNADNGTST